MTLKYIDERSTLQRFPVEFVEKLKSVGWTQQAKYRSRLKGSDTYAEVRLLQAIGSDGVTRHFGLVHAYNLQKLTFTDERFITFHSNLANLGVGDGVEKTFIFPSGQVLPDTVEIQVNGVTMAKSAYVVSEDRRNVTFTTAPTGIVKASYKLSSKAYEPTNRFGIFLYDKAEMARTVEKETLLPVSSNSEIIYKFLNKNVVPSSVTITSGGMTIDALEYTLDSAAGTVTFKSSVASPIAKYSYAIDPVQEDDYGDLIVEVTDISASLDKADDLAKLAYSAIRYIKPSPLTVFSLSIEENYDLTVNRDSLIHYWGSINRDRIILHLQTYAAQDVTKHFYTPLYLGRLINNGRKPAQNTVLIGGCKATQQSIYATSKKLGGISVDYGPETANGNDFPVLHQSLGGMYYQRHHLAFATHDKSQEIPGAGQGPSAYDSKFHETFMYIVHKYDQEVGHLDDVYAMHPEGLFQGAELELENVYSKKQIGIGDGVTKVFHIEHHTIDPLIEVDCSEQAVIYDDDYKTVTFSVAPAKGARICATYTTKNSHIFNVSNTPISPMQSENSSPYVGIGWGVFQKKL